MEEGRLINPDEYIDADIAQNNPFAYLNEKIVRTNGDSMPLADSLMLDPGAVLEVVNAFQLHSDAELNDTTMTLCLDRLREHCQRGINNEHQISVNRELIKEVVEFFYRTPETDSLTDSE